MQVKILSAFIHSHIFLGSRNSFDIWDIAVNMRDRNSLSFLGMIIRINYITRNKALRAVRRKKVGERDREEGVRGRKGLTEKATFGPRLGKR